MLAQDRQRHEQDLPFRDAHHADFRTCLGAEAFDDLPTAALADCVVDEKRNSSKAATRRAH